MSAFLIQFKGEVEVVEDKKAFHLHGFGFNYYLRLKDIGFILELVNMIINDPDQEWSEAGRIATLKMYFDDYQIKKPLPKIENVEKINKRITYM